MTLGLYYGFEGEPISRSEWTALFEDLDARQVAQTELDGARVSTVWLGLDHRFGGDGPPLIYETMIFGGPFDEQAWRWPNRDAALAGHDQAVELARDATAQVESR